MNSYWSSPLIFLFMISSVWTVDAHGQKNRFLITDFGGVGDGKTDNKEAFANAWKNACGTPGGLMVIPKGTFLSSGGYFRGPCSGSTVVRIDGTLLANSGSDVGDFWLNFNTIDGLKIFGNGVIDGNGASTWSHCPDSGECANRPTTLKISHVNNTEIRGLRFVNSKFFHLNIHKSQNLNAVHLLFSAPEDSPNTDGIHIGKSSNVRIEDCTMSTGDDCVSIGDGSRNVSVSGVFCGPGHGISIGSLGKYEEEEDVSGITVTNVTFTKTTNGFRIKTWAPSKSSNVVSDVTVSDVTLKDVRNPIIIDQHYCPSGKGKCDSHGESTVQIKGVKFINVRGSSSVQSAVNLQCSKSHKCQDIEFSGLQITSDEQPTTALCSNADARFKGTNQGPSHCT